MKKRVPGKVCHVHTRAHSRTARADLTAIRRHVCDTKDEPLLHDDGRYYCLFHLPSETKNQDVFEERVWEKLESIQTRIEATELGGEEILSEVENYSENAHGLIDSFMDRTAKGEFDIDDSYDFRYFWFPSEIDFSNFNFNLDANFGHATFFSDAFFDSAKFRREANFGETKFESAAIFQASIFYSQAIFEEVVFGGSADFRYSTFQDEISFRLAVFASKTEFGSSQFTENVSFKSITVLDDAQIFFNPCRFRKNVDYGLAVIKGHLHFEGGKGTFFEGRWLDKGEIQPEYTSSATPVFQGTLDFTNVRSDKPEHISFSKVRLRPNWFVDCDSRKFVLTGVKWENHSCLKGDISEELRALEDRKVEPSERIRMMTVAFRNLAANAEESNRFDEASKFRKSAFECERRHKHQKRKQWNKQLRRKLAKGRHCRRVVQAVWTAPFRFRSHWQRRESVIIHDLYKALSFYGESWSRALVWLITIWIGFGTLYWLLRCFEDPTKLQWLQLLSSIGYSFSVMSFQKPGVIPDFAIAHILYGLQIVLTPIFLALIALAIRRKFMR